MERKKSAESRDKLPNIEKMRHTPGQKNVSSFRTRGKRRFFFGKCAEEIRSRYVRDVAEIAAVEGKEDAKCREGGREKERERRGRERERERRERRERQRERERRDRC